MTKLLKKLNPNPIARYLTASEQAEYDYIWNAEHLVIFYHKLLTRYEENNYLTLWIYEMIAYSTDQNINIQIPRRI